MADRPTGRHPAGPPPDPLASFHPVVRTWFTERFGQPSPPQALGWPLIASGQSCLITAPTGSGKTLAAFLKALDTLWQGGVPAAQTRETQTKGAQMADTRAEGAPGETLPPGVQVLYISPLKALGVDIEKNLREPLAGVTAKAREMGATLPEIRVAVRTGDTPAAERQRMVRRPPHVLITTPESLYLLLTSRRAREMLRSVRYVIVDEIHALLGSKRGSHLALSLERLEALSEHPLVRIGLTATVRPLERAARFLGGLGPDGVPRPVAVADAGLRKGLDLRVEVPVAEMGLLPDDSIWPSIHRYLLAQIQSHRSTLIFVNNRRLAERLAARLNDLAGEELVRTHHGSLGREQRRQVEEELKAGRLPALVATGTLELGIDVGAIDLVVQVESPKSVARGLQRVGRAGHLLGAASKGRIVPKFRADLAEAAAVARGMGRGRVEEVRVPENPLDVLAQQVVAMAAMDEWSEEELLALVRRAYPYRRLSRRNFEGVLEMLAGGYAEADFPDLRPRITWDRINRLVRGRPGSAALAIRSGGTIPDRGLYGIFLDGTEVKLGEIDEEFGFETYPGEVFLFGSSTWRTERVTHDRIEVTPAPGAGYARLPFWHGENLGRSTPVGRQVGALYREVAQRLDDPDLPAWLEAECALDPRAAANLRAYLWELQEHLGAVPSDQHLVAEWFPEELGGWRLALLSPFGGPLHAAWALALRRRYREWLGAEVQAVYGDDGLLLRLPPTELSPGELAAPLAAMTPAEAEELVVAELGSSALLGAHFRMAAERALVLPRHGPRRRTPLWLQRQKAKDLLQKLQRPGESTGQFPILLEAYREVLEDVLDLSGLQEVLRGVAAGTIALSSRETAGPSPAAAGLIWNFTASFLYEGEAPRAERAAAALSLDQELLQDLMAGDRLRELLHPQALAEVEAELQQTAHHRRARSADELHDLLRRLGDLSPEEIAARAIGEFTAELAEAGRAVRLTLAGEERWVAAEEENLYAVAMAGCIPGGEDGPGPGSEDALTPTVARRRILGRFARTRGPFTLAQVVGRYGWDPRAVQEQLAVLVAAGDLVEGGFTPGGDQVEWCDREVLARIRRRTLRILRREVEPRPPAAYARFLLQYQGLAGSRRTGVEGLRQTLEQLEGLWLPAAAWEQEILPRRVAGYQPAWLDQLLAGGEFFWVGRGEKVAFFSTRAPAAAGFDSGGTDAGPGVQAGAPAVEPAATTPAAAPGRLSPEAERLLGVLRQRGASFLGPLAMAADLTPPAALAALWELVWLGLVTNDTFAPLRESRKGPRSGGSRRRSTRAEAAGDSGLPAADTGQRHTSLRSRRAALGRQVVGGTGRWSLVEPMAPAPAVMADCLLRRYGVVAREMAVAEGIPWGQLYPVLRQMELRGEVRQGYLVAGLSGLQYALPAVVESLRSIPLSPGATAIGGSVPDPAVVPVGGPKPDPAAGPSGDEPVLLPLLDPGNPWGALLPLPPAQEGRFRPARVPGSYLILRGGEPVLAVERSGRRLVPLAELPAAALVAVLGALRRLLEPAGRVRVRRRLEVEWWGDRPAAESPAAPALSAAGFERGYRRFTLYPR